MTASGNFLAILIVKAPLAASYIQCSSVSVPIDVRHQQIKHLVLDISAFTGKQPFLLGKSKRYSIGKPQPTR